MTDLDVDDIYGKALSAIKKYWNQKYTMSKEEEKVFEQLMSKPYSQHNYSQHKIGYIEVLPTKQEYELVKEEWADKISQRCFSGNDTYKDHEIFQDESIKYFFYHHFKDCLEKRKTSRNG